MCFTSIPTPTILLSLLLTALTIPKCFLASIHSLLFLIPAAALIFQMQTKLWLKILHCFLIAKLFYFPLLSYMALGMVLKILHNQPFNSLFSYPLHQYPSNLCRFSPLQNCLVQQCSVIHNFLGFAQDAFFFFCLYHSEDVQKQLRHKL